MLGFGGGGFDLAAAVGLVGMIWSYEHAYAAVGEIEAHMTIGWIPNAQ